MLFAVEWTVLDSSDEGTKILASGSTVKEAETEWEIRQALLPLLQSSFPLYTEFSDRDFVIAVRQVGH